MKIKMVLVLLVLSADCVTSAAEPDPNFYQTMLALLGQEKTGPLTLTVHSDQTTKTIDTGIYGQFLEHIFHSVHGGLWGDQILNGTLELRPDGRRRRGPNRDNTAPTPRNWEFVGDANAVSVDRDNPFNAEVSVRLAAAGGEANSEPGIRQPEHRAQQRRDLYTFALCARQRQPHGNFPRRRRTGVHQDLCGVDGPVAEADC